jgi:DME family drug/metabolite transporter
MSENNGLRYLILAGALWGAGGLTGSLLARHTGLGSPAVATYRLGVGGLLLVLFFLLDRWPLPHGRRPLPHGRRPLPHGRRPLSDGRRPLPRGRRAWTRIAILGALAAEFQASYFAAVERVSVSLATLLTIGASPLLVLAAEAATGRRPVTRRALVTVLLALCGLTLLVGVPQGRRDLPALLAGGGFALLAAAGFAALTLVGSRPVDGLDDLAGTGLGFTLGAVLLVPLATAAGGLTFTPGGAGLALLLLLGAGPTAIAYAAYFRGLRRAQPATAALMALLEPLVGTALSVVILGDRLTLAGWAGAALLIAALVLQSRLGTGSRTVGADGPAPAPGGRLDPGQDDRPAPGGRLDPGRHDRPAPAGALTPARTNAGTGT